MKRGEILCCDGLILDFSKVSSVNIARCEVVVLMDSGTKNILNHKTVAEAKATFEVISAFVKQTYPGHGVNGV